MNTTYIVTEGMLDTELIRRIVPDIADPASEVKILTGQGYSSALSLAQSVLLQKNQPALLILDADTNDAARIKEKKEFIEQYVRINGSGKFKVLLAIPTLEVLFFADKSTLESVLQKPIADDVWALAKLSPKQALILLTGETRPNLPALLANEPLRHQIERTAFIQELKQFIGSNAMA